MGIGARAGAGEVVGRDCGAKAAGAAGAGDVAGEPVGAAGDGTLAALVASTGTVVGQGSHAGAVAGAGRVTDPAAGSTAGRDASAGTTVAGGASGDAVAGLVAAVGRAAGGMSSMIAPEPSSSIAGAEVGIAGAEAGRFASACPPRPEHPAARRVANTNDRMDNLCAIMEGIVHAAADGARVEKGCAVRALPAASGKAVEYGCGMPRDSVSFHPKCWKHEHFIRYCTVCSYVMIFHIPARILSVVGHFLLTGGAGLLMIRFIKRKKDKRSPGTSCRNKG